MHKDFKNYIFDLDGTLINSSEEVLLCFKKAFLKTGYNLDEKNLTPDVIGPPIKEIIKLLAPNLDDENIINSVIKNFREIYDYDNNDISVLYDGVSDYLSNLKKDGAKIFLATLKPKIPTIRLVEKFFPDIFDDIYTIDMCQENLSKKEMIENIILRYNLNKQETVMIGDAVSDVVAAKEVDITGIGCLWGYCKDKIKLEEHADVVINKIEEVDCLKLN